MKISTHITLTQADILEAIEQYINAHGVNTEGMDVKFEGALPDALTVMVSEAQDDNDEKAMISSENQSAIVDYSQQKDVFTPPHLGVDENEKVEPRTSSSPRPFNPFVDGVKNKPIQVKDQSQPNSRIDWNTGTIVNKSVNPLSSKRIFD